MNLIGQCTNSKFYHNNFINNTNQAYDNGNNSTWDNGYPSGGNYWSDWTTPDLMSGITQNITGSDGVVDNPINITRGSYRDSYPLISPPSFGKFSIPIILGWNFVSIPLIQCNTSIPNVLSSIDGQWDVVKYYDTTDAMEPWKTYRVDWSTNDLFNIDHTMGFWLHVTDVGDGNFTIDGRVPTATSIALHAGWNMVGYPTTNQSTNISTAFAGIDTYRDQPVEGYDPGDPYLLQQLPEDYIMRPGEGYWVHVTANCTWTVDW